MRLPWFVLTILENDHEGPFERTLLLSHLADLAALIGTHPVESFQGLHLVAHAAISNAGIGWETLAVRKVWKAEESEDDPNGTLFCEDEMGRMLDEFGSSPRNPRGPRTLLVEFPKTMHKPTSRRKSTVSRTASKP
jgi:hypothetical protein